MDDMVYAVAVVRRGAAGEVILAGQSSGLKRSLDGGLTWEDALVSLGLPASLPVMALGVEGPTEGGEAGDRLAVFAGAPGGVLSSTDGAATWTAARLPEPPPVVSSLAVSPAFTRDGVVLAGTVEDGVFRSADRGRTWTRWNFGLLDLNVLALAISPDFTADETLFAGTESGVFCSTNGGRAWREVNFPMDLAPVLCLAVSPHYLQDRLIFAGTEASGLQLSRDAGKTWSLAADLFDGATVNAILLEQAPGAPLHCLVLVDDRLVISRDAGLTWGNWETPLPENSSVTCVAAPCGLAQGNRILVGTVEGEVLWI
jgi:photosystem II stability/assembly factor-like uncharacterized protein